MRRPRSASACPAVGVKADAVDQRGTATAPGDDRSTSETGDGTDSSAAADEVTSEARGQIVSGASTAQFDYEASRARSRLPSRSRTPFWTINQLLTDGFAFTRPVEPNEPP